jgi:hypothetical protein
VTEFQSKLFGEQIYSCCHCSWEGAEPTVEVYDVGGYKSKIQTCPKCKWAAWTIQEAVKMTNLYGAFKRKYGGKKKCNR